MAYFQWKLITPPWCNDGEMVKRYTGLVAKCEADIKALEPPPIIAMGFKKKKDEQPNRKE